MRIIAIGWCLILSGCGFGFFQTGPKPDARINPGLPVVHLHLYNEFVEKEIELVELLRDAGYEVKVRENKPPTSNKNSYMVYGIGLHQEYLMIGLREILLANGVESLDMFPFQTGRHYYSDGNVGVYLF